MKFNQQAFNRHLVSIGQQMEWRRSYSCACVNPMSGAPDPKHQLCSGKGRIWDAPVRTVCGVSRQDVSAEMVEVGVYDSGDLNMTVPENSPMWANAGRFDRVTLLNSTDVFSQPMVRGGVIPERLLFKVDKVLRCFWLDPVTRLIVEGTVPSIDEDSGLVVFAPGTEPPDGTTYSLTGTKFDEYYIFDQLPSDRNEHSGMRLPKRVQLRKWDLFGR
jgi:hypothetical protein